MAVWALGINHTTAPLDLRGRFSFASDQLAPQLQSLRESLNHAHEAAIVSTCNRTEIYCAGDASDKERTLDWLAQCGGVTSHMLRSHTYSLTDDEAARHAFRVASGLDSMVLGEPQILGQLKDAVRAAEGAGALGATLSQLFQRSFAVAKDVRTSTEIGAHSISMAAAVVRLAAQLFEDLSQVKVLFVGAGDMIELCVTHFAGKNPTKITIELPQRLHEFDAVISCTASTLPIIGLGAVDRALKKRKHRPMLMVDLAVPRDIEAEVKALEDIYLYTVDDLASVVQNAQANRQSAVAQAETIVDAGVQSFMHWVDQRDNIPLIQQLNAQADAWRQGELLKARKAISKGDSVDEVMESLAKGLTQKLLHGAFAELHAGDTEARAKASQAIAHFFLRKER
jgi:glutamyl-tRNA reductase